MTRKSSRHIVLGVSLVLLGGCASIDRSQPQRNTNEPAAHGQTPEQDLQAQVQDLRSQLSAANARVESLETRLSSMGDKLETIGASKKKNVVAVEHSAADQAGEEVSPEIPSTDRESGFKSDLAVVNYRKAFILYQAKKYADAILAFSSFLERYADHPFAGSAQFYIGDCYLEQGEPKLALQEFQRVLTAYDRSAHIPLTLEKMAQAEDRMKNRESGAKYRQLLLTLFPMSPAASALGAAPQSSSQQNEAIAPATAESETHAAPAAAAEETHVAKPHMKPKHAEGTQQAAAPAAPPSQSPLSSPFIGSSAPAQSPAANEAPATAPPPPSAPEEIENVHQ